jgi:hypothetical protein
MMTALDYATGFGIAYEMRQLRKGARTISVHLPCGRVLLDDVDERAFWDWGYCIRASLIEIEKKLDGVAGLPSGALARAVYAASLLVAFGSVEPVISTSQLPAAPIGPRCSPLAKKIVTDVATWWLLQMTIVQNQAGEIPVDAVFDCALKMLRKHRSVAEESSDSKPQLAKPLSPDQVRAHNRALVAAYLKDPPRRYLDGFGRRQGAAYDELVRAKLAQLERSNARKGPISLAISRDGESVIAHYANLRTT